MNRRCGSEENIPMGILRGQENGLLRPTREVRLDTSNLPSRNYDPELSYVNPQRVPIRRRTWTQPRSSTVHDVVHNLPSHTHGGVPDGTDVARFTALRHDTPSGLEQHAAQIVMEMERDLALMEDNPLAEQLRMETLKEMPESLTLKRSIRSKLVKTVSQKSSRSPISFSKRMKYSVSMSMAKFNLAVKNLLYSLELWYQSLKIIEGHFGSGVATYFKFLRWLFVLNVIFCIMSVSFVVVPRMLYRFYEPLDDVSPSPPDHRFYEPFDGNSSDPLVIITPVPESTESYARLRTRSEPYESNDPFSFADLFMGEGFLTNTTLFYGFYVNDTLHVSTGVWYSIPNAYFFTAFACYIFIFIILSISMARSYRKSFIETAGGLKNVYAHKIFCGWDFSIATGQAAKLKSKSIYNELKELLGDESIATERHSLTVICNTLVVQISLNVLCVMLLGGTAALTWTLLDSDVNVAVVSVVVTLVMTLAPMLFSWLLRFEDYRNPRTALYVTLMRTFLLELVVVAVLVAFWLKKASTVDAECWETSLAQEVYRLILMDFWFAIVGTAVAETLRSQLCRRLWPALGVPEFDIARNTLNLIYNQTLFWIGAFFSPLLSLVIVIKMVLTFYIKKVCVLKNCQPSSRSWRAAQTQTMFLVLSFLSLLGIVSTLGYIITQIHPSDTCGPFSGYEYMYEVVLSGFQLERDNGFWRFLMSLTKPGVVGGILLAMCAGVYYLRAKSHARRRMVVILREMLVLEARDKEFLLSNISKVTEGQWMYNLKRGEERFRSRVVRPTAAGDHSAGQRAGHDDGVPSTARAHNDWNSESGSTPGLVSSEESNLGNIARRIMQSHGAIPRVPSSNNTSSKK